MALPNVNSDTGIRFGVIDGHKVPTVEEYLYEHGRDLDREDFEAEVWKKLEMVIEKLDCLPSSALIQLAAEIPGICVADSELLLDVFAGAAEYKSIAPSLGHVRGYLWGEMLTAELVQYEGQATRYFLKQADGTEILMRTDGPPNIFVMKSDRIVHVKRLCSLCYPNAGDLSSGFTTKKLGYKCYGLPRCFDESEPR